MEGVVTVTLYVLVAFLAVVFVGSLLVGLHDAVAARLTQPRTVRPRRTTSGPSLAGRGNLH